MQSSVQQRMMRTAPCLPGASKLSLVAKAPSKLVSKGPVQRSSATAAAAPTGSAAALEMPATKKKITGKTAVVTGGSQGVGRELALSLARKGYNVVVIARQPERLQEVADSCGSVSGRPEAGYAFPADIADVSSMQRLSELMMERYEGIDLLVNNAGICMTGRVEDTPLSEVKRMMDINFMGAVNTTTLLLPQILASAKAAKSAGRPGPSIVMVNSFAARIPLKLMAAYTATKYALAGWTDAFRPEVAGQGIHVAQVQPGVIKSDFLERATWYGASGEDSEKQMKAMFEGGPTAAILQTPAQVAEAVMTAVEERQNEVVVGPVFNGAITSYRLTGINMFDTRP